MSDSTKNQNGQDSYLDTFDARGDLYNEASQIHRSARDIERQILIEYLQIERQQVLCDVPAGGGYLADGLRSMVNRTDQIVCVEPSGRFSRAVSSYYVLINSPIDSIPVNDAYFDRLGSLAGLHHVHNKLPFFQEAQRVLKPGGIVAVGDVLADTPVAKFLNGPVDEFTESGHRGEFLRAEDLAESFSVTGLVEVTTNFREFYWSFDSDDQMVAYCATLFGMVKATETQVRDALYDHFTIEQSDGKCQLPWALVYGVAQKPF